MIVCRVINNGSGNISSVTEYNRTRGTIDVTNGDELTTDVNPTQDYHVGNRLYNDLRHVKKTGTNTYDIEVIDTAAGTNSSKIVASLTGARTFTLPDRSITIASTRQAFKLLDFKASLSVITPSDSEPWFDINQNATVLAANWTELVPALRAIFGSVNGTTNFSITGFTPGSPTTVLQFANNAANNAFLLALQEEQNYHGSFVNFRTLSVITPFGDLAAGDYAITAIDTSLRTVDITATTTSSSAGTVRYYPFRIDSATSTVNARWFKVEDATLRTIGGDVIPFFRVRDRIQSHNHSVTTTLDNNDGSGLQIFFGGGGQGPAAGAQGRVALGNATSTSGNPTDSGTGAGTPRHGTTTRDRGLAVYFYIFGSTFVP